MNYVKLNSPLGPKRLKGLDSFLAVLDRADAWLISYMADPKVWHYIDPPAKRIEIIDLSDTFDAGIDLIIVNGRTTGWIARSVF